MTSALSDMTRFSATRPGPEAALQDQVETRLDSLFDLEAAPVWCAGGVPIGAGQPDLIVAKYDPVIAILTTMDGVSHHDLMGYLRVVGRATPPTIAERLGRSVRQIDRWIDELAARDILVTEGNAVGLSVLWRDVLEDIISIEVKVSDWRRAAHQAIRNTVLVHRSYVALPAAVARRAAIDDLLRVHGIGVLALSANGEVRIVKRARRSPPKVWSYYYALAELASHALGERCRAVHHCH